MPTLLFMPILVPTLLAGRAKETLTAAKLEAVLNSKLIELERQVSILDTQRSGLLAEVEAKRGAQAAEVAAPLVQAKAALEAAEAAKEALESEAVKTQIDLQELRELRMARDAAIEDLTGRVAELDKSRAEDASELSTLRTEATELRSTLEAKESALVQARAELTQQSAASADRAAALEADTATLRTQLEQARADLASAQLSADTDRGAALADDLAASTDIKVGPCPSPLFCST